MRRSAPIMLVAAVAALSLLAVAGATASVRAHATPTTTSAACNSNKIVVTYYSEPSIMDFQQFGTDGDNDVRANIVGTLLGRKPVAGKYPGTTSGVTGQYVGQLASSWNLAPGGK